MEIAKFGFYLSDTKDAAIKCRFCGEYFEK